jgi:hypothetical protein
LGVHFVDSNNGWTVGEGGTILATRDGGTTWEPQKSGTDKDLDGVHFADAHTGWAVGDRGTMVHSGAPIYPPAIKEFEVTSKGLNELDVSFRVKPDPKAEVTAARVSARVGEAAWSLIGAAMKTDAGDGGWQRWHLDWKPKTIAHSGDDVDYQVQLDDGGPPFGISLGTFRYDPLLARLWRENRAALITALGVLAFLLIYAGYFAGMLFVAPARLASIGGAPGLDADIKLEGWVALVWKLGRSILETVTLPSMSRHPRVRHAWTALYRAGNAKFEDLGKSARTSFVLEPQVLDAWVARAAPKVERVSMLINSRAFSH